MSVKYIFILVLCYSSPLLAHEECPAESQTIFCRLLRCVEGTHWKSDKILDPFQIIKEDKNFEYDTMLMPVSDGKSQFSFLAINSSNVITYTFPESIVVGPRCEDKGSYGQIKLKGRCRSSLPFGLGCLFREPTELKVNPYRVSYWDGRKVGFLCTDFVKSAVSRVKLSSKKEPIQEFLSFGKLILKNRMKQLARAIRADKKNMDIGKIMRAIKDGQSIPDTGACRYFLDGNTLNLVLEEINKPEEKK